MMAARGLLCDAGVRAARGADTVEPLDKVIWLWRLRMKIPGHSLRFHLQLKWQGRLVVNI
ncbi:MAG: hypothetical protein HoeaKO_06720 [Hoeflea alexandrii]